MSLLRAIKAQLGLSVTPANNFTLDVSADNGTMKLARGNAGATTQDIMLVDAAGQVTFPQFKSGEVLQEKLFTDAGNANAAPTYFKLTANFSFTPKSTNSTIFISMFFEGQMGLVSGQNPVGTFAIKNTADEANNVSPEQRLNVSISAGGLGIITPCAITGVVANTSLAARSYALYSKSSNSGSSATGAKVVCSIREVQN